MLKLQFKGSAREVFNQQPISSCNFKTMFLFLVISSLPKITHFVRHHIRGIHSVFTKLEWPVLSCSLFITTALYAKMRLHTFSESADNINKAEPVSES